MKFQTDLSVLLRDSRSQNPIRSAAELDSFRAQSAELATYVAHGGDPVKDHARMCRIGAQLATLIYVPFADRARRLAEIEGFLSH